MANKGLSVALIVLAIVQIVLSAVTVMTARKDEWSEENVMVSLASFAFSLILGVVAIVGAVRLMKAKAA